MTAGLRFGPLGANAVHLCIDMQTLFAERTDWHVPWLERVLPAVMRLAEARPARTLFTRFVPPQRPEDARGTWRRYYAHWREMTGERLDPRLIQLVPPLPTLAPPAIVIDKSFYSPFKEPTFLTALRRLEANALIITGGETDVCVLAAVMDAVDCGYRTILTEDALCSVSDESHDAMLRHFASRFGQQIEVASPAELQDSRHYLVH
jgi:nicotinamidase-related amidase